MNEKKIFIVEEDKLNLKLFNEVLVVNGFSTSFTLNGFSAFDEMVKYLPGLIIINIQLQGISGFDIIKKLKNDARFVNVPVIAITSLVTKDFKSKIFNAGFSAYIAKPISIDAFLNVVTSMDNFICNEAI